MSNRFALTKTYIEGLASLEGPLLLEALETSQAFLHRLFMQRNKFFTKGYDIESLSARIKVLYYAKDGLFVLCDIDGYGNPLSLISNEPPLLLVEKEVMPLLKEEENYLNNDSLLLALRSYASFTDWFMHLLDALSSEERKKIPLLPSGSKQYQKALEIVKKEVTSLDVTHKKEDIAKKEKEEQKVSKKETKQPSSLPKETLSSIDHEKEAEALFKEQEAKQRAIIDRLRERLGVHFAWEERFIEGKDADHMLTLIERVYRRSSLKNSDKNWIIVATYEVSEEDFTLLLERYPFHLYRADDLAHKPPPETVDLAIVVKPLKKENVDPYAVKKVKYKGATFASHPPKNRPIVKDKEDEEDEEVFLAKEETFIVPKRWKCPLCPKKNPWHTGEPSRVTRKKDGEYICLCSKHRKANIN